MEWGNILEALFRMRLLSMHMGIIVGSEVGDYFIGHGLLHGLLLSVYLLPASPKEERFGNFCLE